MSKRIIMLVLVISMFLSSGASVAMAAVTNDTEYNYSVFQANVTYEVVSSKSTNANGSTFSTISLRHKNGTFFFIEDNLFVTAAHVVQGEGTDIVSSVKTRLKFVKENGNEYYIDLRLKVAYVDTVNDIAILYGNEYSEKYCKPLKIDYDKVASANDVFTTCGYAGTESKFTISSGIFEWYGQALGQTVEEMTINQCDYTVANRLIFEADAFSGMSGGPVLDSAGNVVAVLTESIVYPESRSASAVRVSYLKAAIENLRIQEEAAKSLEKPAA